MRRYSYEARTLATVVIDIRIIRVVLNGVLKALERGLRISLLHMHTSNLHQTLGERGNEADGLEKIGFSTFNVTSEESTWPSMHG